ncbi:MAG: GDP-mannose 4,6-dehydratase [Thermoproteales archaeon]|nr:GDP-mannose 4,6-dehydratase [Thermoproteales archaeon]
MKVIVTGGAGFIGHHVALHLLRKGYEVTVIDNLSRSKPENVENLRKEGIEPVKKDILAKDLPKVFSDLSPDAVVHAAALISVDESMRKPLLYHKVNSTGTLNVLRACVKAGCTQIVYLSSAAVYGNPVNLPIDECHPLNPLSPYGASKLSGELYVRVYEAYGLKSTVLRLFNVYGPGQSREYAGVIMRFIERVKKGLPPIIFGDGKQTRDFIYVDDVVSAVELALKKRVSGVFNIATGQPVTILGLAKIICRLAGLDLKPVFQDPRPGDIRHSYASIEKARKKLKWRPEVSLETGLRKLLKYTSVL